MNQHELMMSQAQLSSFFFFQQVSCDLPVCMTTRLRGRNVNRCPDDFNGFHVSRRVPVLPDDYGSEPFLSSDWLRAGPACATAAVALEVERVVPVLTSLSPPELKCPRPKP